MRSFAEGKAREILPEGRRKALTFVRTVSFLEDEGRTRLHYRLKNRLRKSLGFLFGSEMNLNLLDAHFNRLGEAVGVRRFALVDPLARKECTVALSRPARLWYFPVETIRQDRKRTERVYQGVRVTCVWEVRLAPGGTWTVRAEIGSREPDVGD